MSRPAGGIRTGESVTCFPTFASWLPQESRWNARLLLWIHHAEENWRVRSIALTTLRRALNLSRDADGIELMKTRLGPFLYDGIPGRTLTVKFGEHTVTLPESDSRGYIQVDVEIPASSTGVDSKQPVEWLTYEVPAEDANISPVSGRVQLVPESGTSVVSDIDDTIKESAVATRRELLANTFLRPFRAVSGMADWYRRWATAGATLHYVSSSPWQLYPPLAEWLNAAGFPLGSMHLRRLRLRELRNREALAGSEEQKRAEIDTLLNAFPNRRFIFVGDAGERDPELYADVAAAHPEQVHAIYIRSPLKVDGELERMQSVFQPIGDRWQLFHDAAELTELPIQP